jgi:NADH-quinone oxidoreductase subunit J
MNGIQLLQPLWLLADSTDQTVDQVAQPAGWDRLTMLVRQPHPLASGVILGGLALWLMLPRGSAKGRSLGAVLGIAALACLGSRLLPLGDWSSNTVFWILSAVTVISAACTVTFRSPVYCAVWFAMTLTGTSAIFMVQGAQFLAVATIVVYAGAILVTFLFVLMLAQPRGDAYYDRISWEALLAAATGAVLLGILSVTIGKLKLDQTSGPELAALQRNVLVDDHVAHLGAELFGRHLIAVEVAGTLLLIALVGATAIVGARRQKPSMTSGLKQALSNAPDSVARSNPQLQESGR